MSSTKTGRVIYGGGAGGPTGTVGPVERDRSREGYICYLAINAWINGRVVLQRYADLQGADLCYLNLSNACLNAAKLQGAGLMGTNLTAAQLIGADLNGANLRGANLSYALLSNAHLRGASLRGANAFGADLRDANLEGTEFWETKYLNHAALRGAIYHGTLRCYGIYADRGDHVFHLLMYDDGPPKVRAGCRLFTIPEYRRHARSYFGTGRWRKTRAILNLFEEHVKSSGSTIRY
jgi:hypothetical protein